MKKRLNRIAVLLWIAAAVVALIDLFGLWAICTMLGRTHDELLLNSGVVETSGLIEQVCWLVGLGTLIEIADRILCELKNRNG